MNPGLGYVPLTVFKVFCPLGNCSTSTVSTFYVTLTDSFGDGWNGNVLGIRQNGVTKANLNLASGFQSSLIPITLEKFKIA